MMGSGKTTVGELLAKQLGATFVDSDEQVEAATGRSVREIWESDGEAAFRKEEAEALKRAVTEGGGGGEGGDGRVIGVAGGAVLDPSNRLLIAEAGTVVWLRAKVETLVDRVSDSGGEGDGEGDHRPLLADDPEGTLTRLSQERRALYEEVADIIVDVDDATPEGVVERIMEQL